MTQTDAGGHSPYVDLPRRLAYVPLAEIRPAQDNGGRVHDLPAIIAVIRDLGFNDPLIEDDRTGRLVGGHGRVEGLVEMKARALPPPDGIVVDDDGEWLVPVMRGWNSRTTGRATAQLLAFNQLPTNGRYNDYGLARLIESVITEEPTLLDATGFDADTIDDILRHVTPEKLSEPDPDDPFGSDRTPNGDEPDSGGEGTPDVYDNERPPAVECPACAHRWEPPGWTPVG